MAISIACLFLVISLAAWTLMSLVPTKIPDWVRTVLLAIVLWMLALAACGWLEI